MMHRTARVAVASMLVCVAACGTRLPHSAFATTTVAGQPSATTAPGTTAAGGANTASDTGVTANEIRVGLVASVTSPLGGDAFSQSTYSVKAYFDGLNARGGVNGRKVTLFTCDDGASGQGNNDCVHKLIDQDKVFAFVGNTSFNYAGAQYVNDQAVPDIGGQPVGSEYDKFAHLFSIYGSSSPRNGTVGFNGKLYGGTEVYRYFKDKLKAKVAAVVSYNIADSQRFAGYTQAGLEAEGYTVVNTSVDFGVSAWDAVAINFRNKKVDVVFDAIENTGNVSLCKALDRNNVQLKARVLTVQSWGESVRTDYADSPNCRNVLYATSNDLNYADTQYPVVKAFRDDMARSFPDRADKLSMWSEEGWGGAQWFTDAAESCGAQLTRVCVEKYMNRAEPYDGHGLFTPRAFEVSKDPKANSRNCLNVARWQDSAQDGKGGWVTQTPNMDETCYEVPSLEYDA